MQDDLGKINDSIDRSAAVMASLREQAGRIRAICDAVIQSLSAGGKILTAGHGGSAADALHMSEEFVGRFDRDRKPLPAIALVADPTLITCIANDFGFESLFPRQVQALGQRGDVLVLFSTSGNGNGLQRALETAKEKQMTTIALIGKTGGQIRGMATHELIVASDSTARIQEAHTLIMHIILEAVDRVFAPEEENE